MAELPGRPLACLQTRCGHNPPEVSADVGYIECLSGARREDEIVRAADAVPLAGWIRG
jgi:hypothetical protein